MTSKAQTPKETSCVCESWAGSSASFAGDLRLPSKGSRFLSHSSTGKQMISECDSPPIPPESRKHKRRRYSLENIHSLEPRASPESMPPMSSQSSVMSGRTGEDHPGARLSGHSVPFSELVIYSALIQCTHVQPRPCAYAIPLFFQALKCGNDNILEGDCADVISQAAKLLPMLAQFYQAVGRLDMGLIESINLQSAIWAVKQAKLDAETKMVCMKQPESFSASGAGLSLSSDCVSFDSLECYTVLEEVGQGAFAKVNLARHNPSGRSVVLKVVDKSVTQSRVWQTLKEEGGLLARLQHPFIVRLYSTIAKGESVYYVMEYVSGGDMFKYIRERGGLSEECARFYAASMVLTVEYLNGLHIAHRDIKPENVLLDQEGYMKLVDFGLAKFLPNRATAVVGTPDYIAPEIIKMRGYTSAVDIWALGVYIFEMTHAYSPFHGKTKMETFVNILKRDPPISTSASPELRDLLQRLLARDTTWRLGNTASGFAELKAHPFFATMDWNALYNRELVAPIQPKVTSPWDTSNYVKVEDGKAVS